MADPDLSRLVGEARRLAELNRTEGWNGNDCDAAMRVLNDLADAASESATLRARVATLEEALKPFADWVPHGVSPDEPDDLVWEYDGETLEDGTEITNYRLTVGDYRRAACVLKAGRDAG